MKKNKLNYSILQFLLILLSAILFVMANPNFLFKNGLGFIAWFYYIPVFFIVKRSSEKTVFVDGFLYGLIAYGLYAYWLCKTYLWGFFVAVFSYGIILGLVFVGLKYCEKIFTVNSWIIQCLLLCSYEYIKTLGFLGMNYGVTAYTQYKFIPIIQICDLVGVFGFNALIIFSSGILYSFIYKILENKRNIKKSILNFSEENKNVSHVKSFLDYQINQKKYSLKISFVSLFIFSVFFVFSLIYGFNAINNEKTENPSKKVTVCAIQNCDDPWENNFTAYYNSVRLLMKLTEEALEINPNIEIVVWPETAVVPAIVYYYENSADDKRHKLSLEILEYVNSKNVQFVIGNGHKVSKNKITNEIYNSALVFDGGVNVFPPKPGIYSKMHLVPFTEYFPLKKQLPGVYKFLVKKGHQMWTPGKEINIFNKIDFSYGTPICFEDTFSGICRKMVLQGAEAFISISNDSWASSESCQKQHLAMSVFRCVENKVPALRCTNNGVTCEINSLGKITKQIKSFEKSYLITEIKQEKNHKLTFYSRFGDYAGILEVGFFILLLIIRGITDKLRK